MALLATGSDDGNIKVSWLSSREKNFIMICLSLYIKDLGCQKERSCQHTE